MVWFFFIAKQAPLVLKKADDRIEEIDSSNEVTDEKTAFNAKPKKTKSKRVFLMIRNFTIYISYLFFDPLFLYYLGYVTFAILGMFNPIFVALLLLDVFVRFLIFFYFVYFLIFMINKIDFQSYYTF